MDAPFSVRLNSLDDSQTGFGNEQLGTHTDEEQEALREEEYKALTEQSDKVRASVRMISFLTGDATPTWNLIDREAPLRSLQSFSPSSRALNQLANGSCAMYPTVDAKTITFGIFTAAAAEGWDGHSRTSYSPSSHMA